MTAEKRDVSQAALIAAVILVGLNLRAFLTAVGPLAPVIQGATGLGLQGMSLLTLAPMILMGVCAFAGPWLQSTFGARAAVLGALVILGIASGLRMVASDGIALIGTAALCGLGVAIIQAVFPGVIKTYFPTRFAAVMGLYASMLMAGGAFGAQISPVVAAATDSWQLGLGWTVVPAVIAFVAGLIALPRERTAAAGGMGPGKLLRRPRTWLLMACFGLVNGGYSSCVAWLAAYYQTLGWTSTGSGRLLAVMAVAQAAAAMGFPIVASRRRDRRLWIWITLVLQITGFAGLILAPLAAPAFLAAAVGAGLGGCFALSMVVALDHLDHPAPAGALSALMQGGGFLIAAVPPWIVAILHDISGSFTAGWLMHLTCIAVVAVLSTRLLPGSYAVAMGRDVTA